MIGTISFPFGGELLSASMDNEGRWTSTNPTAAAILNAKFRCDPRDYSPAHGEFGHAQISKAAKHFGGQVTYLEPIEETPEGVVH